MTAVDAMQAELRRDGDKRHRSAKQAEALTEICRRSIARDHKPTSELSRRRGLPHVSYIVDLKDYEATHPDLVAEIRIEAEHVGALSRTTLDRIMCDCEITRIITDGPSVVIDVGRKTRNVPDKLWNALVARDRHCQAPGCDRKPAWCDAHHVFYWGRRRTHRPRQPQTPLLVPPPPRTPPRRNPTKMNQETAHSGAVARTRQSGQSCASGTLWLMKDASGAVGPRVLVIGMAGSGKSTFSRALGEDGIASDSPRPPLLEAGLGEAVRDRVA